MVLQTSDFASTSITDEGYQPSKDFVAVYDRDFGPSTTTTGATFEEIFSEANLTTSASEAQFFLIGLNIVLGTSSGRKQFAREIAKELGKHVKPKNVHVGRPLNLSVGDSGLLFAVSIQVAGSRFNADFVAFQRDRVVGAIVLSSLTKIKLADARALAVAMVGHVNAGLSPQNTAPPAIVGTPARGQTLFAATGTWLNHPTDFTYQWQRCDASGANCQPISGATANTYTVTASDAGSTLRVTVTATNTIGASAPASSSPTTRIP